MAEGKELDIDKFGDSRVFRHRHSEQSFVFTKKDEAGIVGNENVNIISSDEANFINGPVGFGAFPQDIRFGGMWSLNPALISCIPSTIATPVPVMLFKPPGLELMSDIATSCSTMGTFLV